MKPIFKTKLVEIEEAFCPKCEHKLIEQTDSDVLTLMTWHCCNCHYSY